MKSLDPLFKKLYEHIWPSDESHTGWLKFKIKEGFCKELDKFILNDCLQMNQILYWLKSLVTKSLNRIQENDNIKMSESSPALILILRHNSIHMDLVSSFKFSNAEWPKKFRSNSFASSPLQKLTEFLLDPKAPCPIDMICGVHRFTNRKTNSLKEKKN
ncbi:hypothetical protein GWI33_021172 [Rhynchophorus ferrugineus]|uniref:Mab-21-like nucleotidyltransferase domain-containing protein n=1 Tax=Rhynchophorus ferrugineus TaxID=354439 RepID=A0A834HQL4_RHYFE|nr:hypothetical protein GWI33_021172 [Rhynchophorus ferrugineus]